MLSDYSDITSRLGEPLWWDPNGVPRYEPFKPRAAGVYIKACVLVDVRCQACPKTFKVCVAFDLMKKFDGFPQRSAYPNDECFMNALGYLVHYGDPPRHAPQDSMDGCISGDTMNSVPIKIIEAWEKVGSPLPQWRRIEELNDARCLPCWAKEDIHD